MKIKKKNNPALQQRKKCSEQQRIQLWGLKTQVPHTSQCHALGGAPEAYASVHLGAGLRDFRHVIQFSFCLAKLINLNLLFSKNPVLNICNWTSGAGVQVPGSQVGTNVGPGEMFSL
jgi:hypothetical protein